MKSTKKSIISAIVVIAICFTMLVGSTFAWFTDSSSVGIQAITTGTLDLVIEDENGADLQGKMLIWDAFDDRDQDEIFWEPGATYETTKFYIVNNGNLSFKFKIALDEFTGDTDLLDVITFDIIADASQMSFTSDAIMNLTSGNFDLLEGIKIYDRFSGSEQFYNEYTVAPGTKVGPLTVKAHMAEFAGNEYMSKALESIGFTVLATQATVEEDSADATYDNLATYPGKAFTIPNVEESVTTTAGSQFNIETNDGLVKVSGTANGNEVKATVKELADTAISSGTLTQIKSAGKELVSYDIDVEGNDGETEISIYLGVNLGAVEVYHNGALMTSGVSYDKSTGYVTIKSSTFSPFEITYIDTKAVTNIEQIRTLLQAGESVVLGGDITNSDTISSPYGKTGALVVNGGVLDGAGHEAYITGADNTWDCGIYTYGGTIKNLTIGGAFRGIFTGGLTSDLIVENVVVDKTCYTIHADGTYADKYMFIVKDSVINGWTSYSNVYKHVEWTNCKFGKGTGAYTYAYCRPYNDSTFTNCTFSEDYSGFDSTCATSTFINCYKGKTLITDSNKVELLGESAKNIVIKNK